MSRKKDILNRLAERLAKGEISEATYLSIKSRYEKNGFPEDDEDESEECEKRVIVLKLNGQRGMPFSVFRGDFEGENFDCFGVGKVSGDLKTKIAKVIGVCKVGGDCDIEDLIGAGTCKIGGDLNVTKSEVSGLLDVGGDIKADAFNNFGMIGIGGSLDANQLKSSGTLKVGDEIEANEFINSGACSVGGGVDCKGRVVQSGALKAGGDIKAETFESTGSFDVKGKIQAKTIKVEVSSGSRAEGLDAEEIRVTAKAGGGILECKEVNGKLIFLEATKADKVEGDNVEIGPRCNIERVIAKTLKTHETARIKKKEVAQPEDAKK